MEEDGPRDRYALTPIQRRSKPLILTVTLRHFSGAGSNEMAGFLLGVLLLVLGVAGLLVSGSQTDIVDPELRNILIEDSNRLGTCKRSIPFDDVLSVGIGFLGKKSNMVSWYYLALKL